MSAEENKSPSLKAAAEGYWSQGLNIVLTTVLENGNKLALHTWKQWETRRQTREEFDALPWLNAERFAVVCGVQGSNGLFFCSIDTDNPDFDRDLLRITQTEKTPRRGFHFIYWSRVNARGHKLHDLKIELLGQGNLCIMYPSKGYATINDNSPTEIDNINEVFEGLAEKLGGHAKRSPIDVRRLLEGVKVGERDTSAIQIAVYYRKKRLNQAEVLQKLVEWNGKNEEPLAAEDLEKTVESAFKTEKPYHYRYVDNNINPARRSKNVEKEKLLQPSKEAAQLLRDPKLLWLIKEDMDREIMGEDENKLLTWLQEVSARTSDYAFVDVLGESAVGKTNLVGRTLRYVPAEWYRKVGRMTRTAIDYLKDQNFFLLWIQEARGAGEAAPSLRLQSSDDGGLTIWVTERDKESGQFTTNEHHVPGRGVITTTTNVSFSPEDATRTWMISADPSEAQTKRIIGYKLAKAREPPELMEALGKKPVDLAPTVQHALQMLDWESPVVIPYADDLAVLFSPRLVRVRRDVDKFLGLIKIIARLHQFQRPVVEINGKRFIIAVAQDALIAFQLGGKPLEETLTGLERRLREVYDAVIKLGIATITQVGVKIHRGSEYARRALSVLVEMGYVDVDESQKTHTYSVRQTENPSSDLQGLQRTFSGSELQKKVNSFLFSIHSQPPADGVDSETSWKKGYFDPISGIWAVLVTIESPPPEVESVSVLPSNLTNSKEKSAVGEKGPGQVPEQEFDDAKIVKVTRLNPPGEGVKCNRCGQRGTLPWYVEDFNGGPGYVCQDCGGTLLEKLRLKGEPGHD